MAEFTEVMKQRKRMCKQFPRKDEFLCDYCPIDSDNNGHNIDCSSFILKYPQEAEEIIMKWAEKNRIKTNEDVWKETFRKTFGINVEEIFNIDGFWDREYKEPKEV